MGDAQVSANSEAVGDTAVQVDLPRLASLDEGLLRFVTELGGEDVVDFCLKPSQHARPRTRCKQGFHLRAAAMDRGP